MNVTQRLDTPAFSPCHERRGPCRRFFRLFGCFPRFGGFPTFRDLSGVFRRCPAESRHVDIDPIGIFRATRARVPPLWSSLCRGTGVGATGKIMGLPVSVEDGCLGRRAFATRPPGRGRTARVARFVQSRVLRSETLKPCGASLLGCPQGHFHSAPLSPFVQHLHRTGPREFVVRIQCQCLSDYPNAASRLSRFQFLPGLI